MLSSAVESLLSSWGREILAAHNCLSWTNEEIFKFLKAKGAGLVSPFSVEDIAAAVCIMLERERDEQLRHEAELAEKAGRLEALRRVRAAEKAERLRVKERDRRVKATARRDQEIKRSKGFSSDTYGAWLTYSPGPDPRFDFMEPVRADF